jgi:hypothetical protein
MLFGLILFIFEIAAFCTRYMNLPANTQGLVFCARHSQKVDPQHKKNFTIWELGKNKFT